MDELKKLMGEMATTMAEMRTKNDQRFEQIEKKGVADPITVEGVKKANEAIAKLEEKQAEILTALRRKSAERVDDKGNVIAPELIAHKAAFGAWARKGRNYEGALVEAEAKAIEAKAMSVGSNPDGGFLVPTDTSGRMVSKVYETSEMRRICSVQSISSDKLEGTYDLDEGSAEWEDEQGTGASDGATPTVGKWTIQTHILKSRVRATQQLLEDAVFDVEAWLADKNARKQERKEANAFLLGNGAGKPKGLLMYTAGTTHGTIEQVVSGANGALQAAVANSGDFFIRLIGALKQPYLAGSMFGLSRQGRMEARLLKNSSGNYIWTDQYNAGPGMQGFTSLLCGYEVAKLDDLPAFATNSLSVVFGNFKEAYQIVDRAGIRVLRDPFTAEPFVKFITSRRVGGAVVNFEAIKIGKLGT